MFTLPGVVPWGRSFAEYCQMFALGDDDLLRKRILGCGDGPASFNAEGTRRGASIISCDPLYRLDEADIRTRIDETAPRVLEQTRQNAGEFVWTTVRSIDELASIRLAAMDDFLSDFTNGKAQHRYVDAELPTLPFADRSFDLALCSHLLFLYSDQLGDDFHRDAVLELCRVAADVRIFPLLALGGMRSPYVDLAVATARDIGRKADIERVPYEFQRGGNQMLRIW